MKESRKSSLSEINVQSNEINTQKTTEANKDIQSSMNLEAEQNLGEIKSKNANNAKSDKKNKKKNVKEVRKNVKGKMPQHLDRKTLIQEEAPVHYSAELADLEEKLDQAAADTASAALYYKVRDAIALYRSEVDEAGKIRALLAVRESAFNYLLEKKGNAPARKQICKDIIGMVDAYARANSISTERNLDYLLGDEIISDKKLDMELMLAGKLTKAGSAAFDGNLKDRRKAFKRKIKDVKLARDITQTLGQNAQWAAEHLSTVGDTYVLHQNTRNDGYDEAIKNIISGYMNMSSVNASMAGMSEAELARINENVDRYKQLGTNMLVKLSAADNDEEGRVEVKQHMIEGILADIMSWKPEDFAFDKPEDFLNRTTRNHGKKSHFMDLYNKLKIAENADALLSELSQMSDNNLIESVFDANMVKEVRARISMYKEIGKEYTNRLEMMNSPYYALLLQEDTEDFDNANKLNALGEDKSVAGVSSKKSVGTRFKNYLKSLVGKKNRLKFGKRSGGEFTRKTDTANLLKWHRKKATATARIRRDAMQEFLDGINLQLKSDNANFKNKWELKANAANEEQPIVIENIQNEENLNQTIEEVVPKAEEHAEEEAHQQAEEEVRQHAEEEARQKAGEDRRKFQDSIKDKSGEIHDKAVQNMDKLNERLDKERNDLLKKQLDYEAGQKAKTKEEIQDKKAKLSPKSAEWLKKFEAEQDEKLALHYMADAYDNMVKDKSSEADVVALRDNMAEKLADIAGVEAGNIKFTPLDQLAGLVKKTLDFHNKADMKKALAKQINDLASQSAKTKEEILGKQAKLSPKSAEWLKKFEAQQDEKLALNYMVEAFDNLSKNDVPMADILVFRDKMVGKLSEITGVEIDIIEFTPMDQLAEFVKYALKNQDKPDMKKELAKQIKDVDDDYSNAEDNAPLLERLKKVMAKGDKMTSQDRIIARDLSALIICLYRDVKEDEEIHHNEYNDVDLETIAKVAEYEMSFDKTYPEEDENFETISDEQARAHEQLCRRIMSEQTDKDPDFFRVIPLQTLSDYVYDILDVRNKKQVKKSADKCLKLATEANDRLNTIDDALEKNERAGIVSAIEKLAGIKADELKGYATTELKDVLVSMYVIVNDPKEIVKSTTDVLKENNKLLGADYYLAHLKTNHMNVWARRHDLDGDTDEEKATFDDLRSMAEYSILLLQQHPGFEDLGFDDYSGLSPDEVYNVCKNVGIIEGLKNTEDEYELNDRAKAIGELAKMKMSEKLSTALQKTLEVDFTAVPELITFKDEQTYIGKVGMKDFNPDLEEARREESMMVVKATKNDHKTHLDKMLLDKKKQIVIPEVTDEDRAFSKEAKAFLDIFGDMTAFTVEVDPVGGMVTNIKRVFEQRASELVWLLRTGENKIFKAREVFSELKNESTTEEKAFYEVCENSFMPLFDAINEYILNEKSQVNEATVMKAVLSKELNQKIEAFTDQLENNIDVFEKAMLPVMTNATADIYNKGEDGEELPDIIEIMDDDMRALISLIDSESKKDALAAAKNTKERLELEKKSEEQKAKERGQLSNMNDDLLYNSKRGQGRFNQLLVSGYYKNASKADRRRMLSYVIREMKKKGTNTTDKERGCEYFASTMKGAGPLMQKMMQGVPERMVIPEMAGALGVVKSSLAPIDPKYVDKVFDQIVKDSNGAITTITDRQSLGAASIGETFKCLIVGPNLTKMAVIKVLRPDAQENMKKDLEFVRRAAMFADMSDAEMEAYEKKYGNQLVDHEVKVTESGFMAQFSEIEKEFDFTNEARNCKLGQANYVDKYNKKKDGADNYHVKSVQLNELIEPHKNYLVMDLVLGSTVDKCITKTNNDYKNVTKTFKNTDPTIEGKYSVSSSNIGQFWKLRGKLYQSSHAAINAQKRVAELAYVWLEQALFGSWAFGLKDGDNFHHGDLHAGNIIIDGRESVVIDYGNAVILKDSKINQILSMMSAVVINSATGFVEAFNNMLELSAKDEEKSKNKVGYVTLTKEQQEEFVKKLDELFKLGTAEDTGKKILIALNVAQSLGVKLPKEIQNFSQCQQRLENTLLETKEAALRGARMMKQMDAFEICTEDRDSFDPLIILHEFLDDPKHRDGGNIKTLLADLFWSSDPDQLMTQVGSARTKEDVDTALEQFLPAYTKLKGKITAQEARDNAKGWRETFNEAYELSKSGKKIPVDIHDKMRMISGQIQGLAAETDFFGGSVDMEGFFELTSNAFSPSDYRSFDKDAFEYLMVIMEEIIPSMFEKVDNIYASLSEKSTDIDKERKRVMNVNNWAYESAVSELLMNPHVYRFRKMLRESKDGEKKDKFERFAARMINQSKSFKGEYVKYRNAEAKLDEARKSGDEQAIKAAEKYFETRETYLIYQYAHDSHEEILRIGDDYEEGFDMAQINKEDYMHDFVSVMGGVVSEHWKRAAAKVNKKLAIEIKNQSKKQEELEKTIKKEEEAEAKRKREEEARAKKAAAAEAKRKKAAEEKAKKEAAKKAKKKKK
ncbi:MAG: hypothetical protein K6G12_05280 [Lachnospiraceae bacterium]|nr:hypothetical protein [Lachnospiraceae bacterium]